MKKHDAHAAPQAAARDESAPIRQLEKEDAELRPANEILQAAAAFFAAELDPRPPR
ncbi:hypothetical protein ACFV23_13835 [Streptomyces sp. NPDC059627]